MVSAKHEAHAGSDFRHAQILERGHCPLHACTVNGGLHKDEMSIK